MEISQKAKRAKQAGIRLAGVKADLKNKALEEIAASIKERTSKIITANQKDLKAAQENNLAAPLLKRLKFDEKKIADVANPTQQGEEQNREQYAGFTVLTR